MRGLRDLALYLCMTAVIAQPSFAATERFPWSSASLECMSCHDGAVGPLTRMTHPLGVVYDSSQFGGRASLRHSSSPSGLGSTIAEDLLVAGRVECTSCHERHSPDGTKPVLRTSNHGSRLCLTCHDK